MSSRCLPLLLTLAACVAAPRPAPVTDRIAISTIAIRLNPANPAQASAGRLRYAGGLWLQSADRRFGGLSGIRWHDGKLYAVSDAGDWFVIDLKEQGGRLTGAGPARVRHLAGLDGKPLPDKTSGDAEALNLHFGECTATPCDPESVNIAFEQDHRVWTYPLRDGMPEGRPAATDMPRDWLHRLRANGGMEAIAATGNLELFIPEQLRTPSGAASALVFHNGEGGAHIRRPDYAEVPVAEGFSPTDADNLDDARFLVLFRRYSLMAGVAARVEEIAVTWDADGRPRIASTPLARFTPQMSVDNMEGLAVRHEDNRTFVYLVSDDNFSPAQRTLLMKFELMPK